jgi:hypothetical protein
MVVFCNIAPCGLVKADRRFSGAYSLPEFDYGGNKQLHATCRVLYAKTGTASHDYCSKER